MTANSTFVGATPFPVVASVREAVQVNGLRGSSASWRRGNRAAIRRQRLGWRPVCTFEARERDIYEVEVTDGRTRLRTLGWRALHRLRVRGRGNRAVPEREAAVDEHECRRLAHPARGVDMRFLGPEHSVRG